MGKRVGVARMEVFSENDEQTLIASGQGVYNISLHLINVELMIDDSPFNTRWD